MLSDGDIHEIYTLPQDLNSVKEFVESKGIKILSAESDYIADDYINPTEEAIPLIEKLINMLEENDDVQNVYHNANLPEEEEDD